MALVSWSVISKDEISIKNMIWVSTGKFCVV